MKISRIQADGILGIVSIDVRLPTAVSLFAGRNGSGKSSIQEAVRMAFTQDQVRDVTKKKDYAALLHDGAIAGGALVTVDDDIDNSFAFNMPKGEFTGPEISESMRVALYGQRFAKMTPDERRTFLFGLTKLKASAATVKPRMLSAKWGCEEAKVDAVLPLLRTGFPSVCDHAKSKATEAKGAWRQLTGETYGPVKGEAWEAPTPELPTGDAAALAQQVEGLDKTIATMSENLGAIRNAARQAQETASRRANLEVVAAHVPRLVEIMAKAQTEMVEQEAKVAKLRERAGGAARVGLIHDMAIYLCGQPDADAKKLVKRYEQEHGRQTAAGDVEAQAALPAAERELEVKQDNVANIQRDLDTAQQAKAQYDALAPAGEAVDASQEIAEVESMLATTRADRAAVESARLDIEAAVKERAAAEQKTRDALAKHHDVVAWTKVADALAPDGIPAEMLGEALAPVNAALEQAAIDTDWRRVVIGADMAITAAGRAYQLLSESEQWRTDAMIAQVVAELSGVRLLMLDRVDVLDLPGRAQLLEWMDALAYNDVIDTALLFGTFKALPEGLADTVTAYWVENGMIANQPQQAAA